MISIPTATLILGGLGACLMLMLRSNSQDERFYRDVQHIADASVQMAMEIEMANAIASTSASAIEFCVPDRDGDFLPEQIRYEWKLDASSSLSHLYRSINRGKEVAVISNVPGFELQYGYGSASSIPNRFRSESVLLKKVDSVPAVEFSEQNIDSNTMVGVSFLPDSLGPSTRWDLGSVEIMIRTADPRAAGKLRLRVTSVLPSMLPDTSSVYADIEISNQDLSTKYQYVEFPLAPITQLASSSRLAVVLSTSAENPPIRLQCLSHASNLPSNLSMFRSSNGGGNWQTESAKSLRFLAIGFTSASSSTVSVRRNLTSVDILMTGMSTSYPTMMASARLLAQPEVP
jgi:hypothetical protein